MARYRKKPVEIEARQLTNENAGALAAWINSTRPDTACLGGGPKGGCPGATVYIETLEGTHHVSVGDFIIQGVQGEFYPCKPDIFAATYDPAEDA